MRQTRKLQTVAIFLCMVTVVVGECQSQNQDFEWDPIVQEIIYNDPWAARCEKKMEEMVNDVQDIKEKNEETRQALNGLKETVADLSRQVARIPKCEDGWSQYRLSCYKVFETEVNYDEATRRCRAHNAHLASIGSEGENSFVAGMIHTYTYIGLDDRDEEGVFTWQDGSPLGYSKWESGQPNNLYGNQDCVNMRSNSEWGDYPCTHTEPYVCEKPPQ